MPTDLNIQSGLSAVLGRMKKRYPQHANRISALDDPCLRKLVYMRTAWDKASDIDDGLQGVFATGQTLEPVIERIASEVGEASSPRWRIVGSQITLKDNLLQKYQISGTIDGLLQVETNDPIEDVNTGELVPVSARWETVAVVDIKTMSPNVYQRINCYDDLCRYPWTKKYRGQLMLYALGYGIDQCCLLLVNKCNLYDMKFVMFPLDYAYCEGLLQKAEAVNAHIDNGTLPDGICDPKECPRCPWFSYCGPDLATGGNLAILDNDDLASILDRMAEIEETANEWAQLAKDRDDMLAGQKGNNLVVGQWLITWSQTNHNPPQWRKTITRMVQNGGAHGLTPHTA